MSSIEVSDSVKVVRNKVADVDDQNREIRTKRREGLNAYDCPLIESLPEESFLRKRKRIESADG